MTRPLLCLVGFAGWALLLVTTIALLRVREVVTGRKRANEFPGGVPHGGDAYWRLNRAHLNTVENLPIFGALVVAGALLHLGGVAFEVLPAVVLGARVVQTLAHVSSGSSRAVNVRFAAFLTQLVCFAWMAVTAARAALG